MRKVSVLMFSCALGTSYLHAQNANTTLSNLVSPTAVNQPLLPSGAGVLDLGSSAATWRNIYFSGGLFISSGRVFISSGTNVAAGLSALFSNTMGSHNTANGYSALYSNKKGVANSATAAYALYNDTSAGSNTVTGN